MIFDVLDVIEIGYTMFDTVAFFQTEEAFGEAICQAVGLGLIKSGNKVFSPLRSGARSLVSCSYD